ncbi:uncharacterized protein C11orf42 homolog [Sceloporus undulatus]|uniref:uncharacterized protein C11orf42 homolog n=1 Tax=Sceloporus undulatus TaxID=8520 RepID=UPI001C4ABAEB|nr:uncharacterized protein C11orf42 homolog [Sceloporus undulatus]
MDGSCPQSLEIGEADANWELIRDKVIEERFGPTVVPVPFLEDAASYDLLTVLIKKPQLGQALLRRQRCLVPVGPLENLLQAGTGPRELTHCTREYNARVRGESRYEETRLVEGALRHIRLTMAGVHKKVAFLVLRPGLVALRPDLPWLRSQSSIYVVYEVFYCSSLSLAITQGETHRIFTHEHPLPVAFSCLKFALSGKGVLGSQKPMGHSLPAKAAWVRMAVLEPPTATPIMPAMPTKDPLLAREKGTVAGRKRWRTLGRPPRTLAGKWLFPQPRPTLGTSTGSLTDPEKHSMSLPLLQSMTAESDTEE